VLQAALHSAGLRKYWRTAGQAEDGRVIPPAKGLLIRAPLPL